MTSFESASTLQEQMIDIFPNPSNGSFSVLIPKGIERIQIFNVVGQEKVIDQVEKEFQMEAAGIYSIHLFSRAQNLTDRVMVE